MPRRVRNGTPKEKQTGLWIPNSILFNNSLSGAEKMLVAEVSALQRTAGCYASNAHFAAMLGVGERRVREMISDLARRAALRVENSTSKRRRLFLGVQGEVKHVNQAAQTIEDNGSVESIAIAGTKDPNTSTALAEPEPDALVAAPTLVGDTAATRQLTSNERGQGGPTNQELSDLPTRQETPTEITRRSHVEKRDKEQKELEEELGLHIPKAITPDLWRRWIKYNADAGRRLSKPQMEAQIDQLRGFFTMGYHMKDVIGQAIAHGWKGFYEPRASKEHMRRVDFDLKPIYNSKYK